MTALPKTLVRDAVAAFRETGRRPSEAESFFYGYWKRFADIQPQYAAERNHFMAAVRKEVKS